MAKRSSYRFDAKSVPLVARNFCVPTVNLLSTTVNDAVETNIVLKRIGTNDVIVVAIKKTNGNAGCLIDISRDRFKFY